MGRWHRDFQPSRSALLATRPDPYLRTKTHLMNITKGTCVTLFTLEIPRVLETLDKDQICISYYESQYHTIKLSGPWSHLGIYIVGMLQPLYGVVMANISEWCTFLSTPGSSFYCFCYRNPGNRYQETLLFEWSQYFCFPGNLKILGREWTHGEILSGKLEGYFWDIP